MAMTNKIKILLVDDSALIRQTISLILKDDPFVEVVGTAFNPFFATEKIQKLKPDVLLLDIQMPEMDGLTYLQKLMQQQPIPVIIFSSFVEDGSTNALRALEYGAVEVIEKPKLRTTDELVKYKDELLRAIKAASLAKVRKIVPKKKIETKEEEIVAESAFVLSTKINVNNFAIAIGASTGGTEAIKRILEEVPINFPPIVITQHMPVGFTKSFSNRLNQLSKITVKEAEDGDLLQVGHAYVARGDRHLVITKKANKFYAKLDDSPLVNRHKPAVDMLFDSVADVFGRNAIGIILTGMGADGSKGLKTMKEKGAYTIAQDEESCIVFGMPKVAIKIGAADTVLPIFTIVEHLMKKLS
jgi:two-component system, chemotaxis family, protein-glutamate methylesterase/glutaminase